MNNLTEMSDKIVRANWQIKNSVNLSRNARVFLFLFSPLNEMLQNNGELEFP